MKARENLKPLSERTKAEQRKIQSLGGKASGKARRERKTIAEALKQVLFSNVDGENITHIDGISVKVIRKMFDNPDIKDVKVLAEILGELKQTIEHEGMAINITSTDEGKSNIEKIMQGE